MKLNRSLMKAGSILAVFILILCLILSLSRHLRERRWRNAGPIENHPVRIYDVAFQREFNDMNEVQLQVARAVGVPPVKDREAAEHMKKKLVEITANEWYGVETLTHSIPFLTPGAAALLERIGRDFQDSLATKGLNPNRIMVTSMLRTDEDVKKLRRNNQNASENSTHCYGTTFDLSYWHYEKIPDLRGRPYADVPPEYLRATLSQVLKAIHDEGTCYIKYEKKQTCFHITTRK